MSGVVKNSNEIILYDTNFPIVGQVRRTAVTPFAPKFTLGDYTRDDKIVTSSWIISTWAGGLGVQNGQLPRDGDRFWYSTLETKYRYLMLGALIKSAGNLGGPADFGMEYNDRLYVCVGSSVYRWTESTKAFTLFKTISGKVNAGTVFNGELYLITDSGLHRYNALSDAWKDYASPDTYIPNGDALIEWDGKLFRLAADPANSSVTKMYWTIDPDPDNDAASTSADWTEAGTLHLPRKYCQQLIIYFDLTGEPVIHAVTKLGVYGYEFTSYKFYQTPLTYPTIGTAGKGATVFRGELIVPAGRNVYKYNGSTIQVVSPSKDDGLPANLRGDVQQVVTGHSFFYSVISTVIAGSASGPSMQFYTDTTPDAGETVVFQESPMVGSFPMAGISQNGAILASPGGSWHGFFDEQVGSAMGYTLVASVEGTYRIWISTGTGMYYADLDTGLHNPLQNPNTEFKTTGYLETMWVDMGWVELGKLALSLDVDADGIDAPNGTYIQVDVAWDQNEQYLPLATVVKNGLTQYSIGGDEGHPFRSVKLRVSMFRNASTTSATPVIRSMIFGFMRRPPMLWGWEVNLNLTKNKHYGKTSNELIERMVEITNTITAGNFVYKDRRTGVLSEKRVLVSNIQGAEISGDDAQGRYTLSVIELDPIDDELNDG